MPGVSSVAFPQIMKAEQQQLLTLLGRPPARLTAEQTAWVLNCAAHDIPVLVAARLLKPLGNPQANTIKLFATVEVLEAAADRAWLSKATQTLQHYWQRKNRRKTARIVSFPEGDTAISTSVRQLTRL